MGGSGWGGGVRVDVNEELKYLGKFKKKKIGGGGGRGGGGGGVWLGGQDGCEQVFVKIKKKKKKIGGEGGGGGEGWGGQGGCERRIEVL